MSDIFKKIRSIEAEDDAVTRALGLTPSDDNTEISSDIESTQTSRKPLNLKVPDDDNILDLDELSLDPPRDDIQKDSDMKIPELTNEETSDLDTKQKSASRLGLTPIMPVGEIRPKMDSVQKTLPKPLPNFLDTAPEELPEPQALKEQTKISPPKPKADATILEPQNGQTPFGQNTDNTRDSPLGKHITIMGIMAALIWLLCVGVIASDMLGQSGSWKSMSILQKLGFGFMALFPLVLIGLCTAAFRHLNVIGHDAEGLKATAQALMRPDDTVISRSTIMAKTIQAQVDEVNLKVSSALTRMELLDDMVKSQGSSLAKSTLAIDTTASDVEHRITLQREGLESIAGLFENRMAMLSTLLETHSSQLASSGQMAEQRVEEARLSVEGAAEKISSASETVRQNAVIAANTLSGSHEEITNLSENVQLQSTRLDAVYRQHLNDLKVMLTDLGQQQEGLAKTMQERLSTMREMSMSAKVGAQNLTEASLKGRETVEALNEAASLTDTAVRARFAEMEDMVKYSTSRAESISETATRQVQNSLSTTRKEIARIEADMMDLMDKLNRAEAKKPSEVSPVGKLRGLSSSLGDGPPPHDNNANELSSLKYENVFEKGDVLEAKEVPPAPHIAANSDLDIYPVSEDDIPNSLRRPSGTDELSKDRNRWSLRGLFNADDGSSPPIERVVNDDEIITRLTTLGLTPAAIVDDGCIIEAANLRSSKSAMAMSEAVASRLGEPVRHLFRAIETDDDLNSDIRYFKAQFERNLEPIETDRERIRRRLESDAGRAYLLCAAALDS